MTKNSTRHNGLADSSPVPDVEGSDKVRLSLKTTGNAPEEGSLRPVFPVGGMAFRAFPARVMWIDCDYEDAHFLSLVFNERPELVERLRVVDVPAAYPNSCPHPYAFEILDGYS